MIIKCNLRLKIFRAGLISKGMVTILCEIYGDRNPGEIAKADFDLLSSLKLDTLLTPGRRNGVYSMLMKIKEYGNVYSL